MTPMSDATIQYYTDIEGSWRWRLVADDGHPLADGIEVFDTRRSLDAHLDRVAERVVDAAIVGPDDDIGSADVRFVVESGHDGEWRWGLYLDDRRIADSGEGYADPTGAIDSATNTKTALPRASISTWGS